MSDLAGTTLGKYRLVEKIGQGGMAQVYRAYQPDLDRYVAIKVLHPHLTGDDEFAARFRQEARAIAALEHPHIVRVYDYGTDGGLAYLVMEYLDGTSLKACLRDLDRRDALMDVDESARIVVALAGALDYAHAHGVVHRDLKPSNVLLTAAGRPVLADFGIAQVLESTISTGSNSTLGTPAYMSPEQGRGEPADARSDVYALGVLLYQLCTGRVPYDADTPYAVILKHLSAPLPPPRSLRPDLPEVLERAILKALAKDPGDRFQTAGEMAAALGAALDLPVPPARAAEPARVRRPRPAVWAIGGGLLALLLLAVLLPGPRPPRRAATPVPGAGPAIVVLSGTEVAVDTWLDPDVPGQTWHDADLVHLQGPLTPDRLLFRFDLGGALPGGASVVSATLTLRVALWGEQSFPGAAVAYRVLAPWEPETATYGAPWSSPGLAPGWDYDATPLDVVSVPDDGWLTFDVSRALHAWHRQGAPNYGLVVMMSEDSHNQAHHWVSMTEQPEPLDRPTLRVAYEVGP